MKQSYPINIDSSILDDLRHRLQIARWPSNLNNDKWETGTNATYLKELCDYWSRDFNWQKSESFLNSFSHFKTSIDGTGIHFIHEKGKGANSFPILLILAISNRPAYENS